MDVASDSAAFAGPSSRRSSAGQLDDDAWDGSAPLELRSKGRSQKVLGACAPCKRAHLACEPSRPCRRCVSMAREDQCIDLPQKKRGRPKLSASTATGQPHKVPRTADPRTTDNRPLPHSRPFNETPFFLKDQQRGPPPDELSRSDPAQGLFAADYSLGPTAAAPPQRPRPLSMTLLTTTDFYLLRASESSIAVLGKPSATLERSWMSDLLPSDDLLALYPLCQWLVSPPGVHLSTDQAAEHTIDTAGWSKLAQAAEGTPYPEKEIRLRRGDGTFVGVNLRMHLGCGAGLDFKRPETFSKAYIVVTCVVSEPSPPSTATFPTVASAEAPRPRSSNGAAGNNNRPMSASAYPLDPHGPSPVALAARQFMRPVPSLPSISTLTNEVDLAQRARATLSAGGGGPAPTFLNPFSATATTAGPMQGPLAGSSQTFRFQQPRPPTSDGSGGRRPHGIVLPPPTMVGFGGSSASRLASPGIYGQHQRPMSTDSGHYAGGGLSKDGLPAFASFAARGSIASIESTFSAAPSDALWSPSVLDEPPPRRRGSALRLGTGDSSNSTMDGIVAQPLEPPAFPFPGLSLRPGSRQ